nr:MAG TPA: hypothetical protein [Caudoviricetes sp.]
MLNFDRTTSCAIGYYRTFKIKQKGETNGKK